jgi:predicted amidophosphoribosyltransferase
VTVLLRQLQSVVDELLGRGLPVPSESLRRSRFAPDRPWSWCPRCGAGSASDPHRCRDADSPECIVRLGAHRGALRRWIVDVKHAGWEPMAELLGALLARQAAACGVVAPGEVDTVVVPVPTPFLRSRSRGIAHAEAIARSLARSASLRCVDALRQRHAGSQVRADAQHSRRARRARFVPRWRSSVRVAGAHVLLVDDVRTTGSTLGEAASVLRAMGAGRVTGLVLSVRE